MFRNRPNKFHLLITSSCAASLFIAFLSTNLFAQTGFGTSGETGAANRTDFQASPGSELRSEHGVVKFRRKIKVPAEVDGKLTAVNVEEGDSVAEGDLIAVIDDETQRLTVELKTAEVLEALKTASNVINRDDAIEAEKLAVTEAKALELLNEKGAVPYFEMLKKQLEANRAKLRIELAEMEIDISKTRLVAKKKELAITRHELTKSQIHAPFSGIIEMEEQDAKRGEWVQAGTPIVSLLQMDILKVEADIHALGTSSRVYAGAPCVVRIFVSGKNGEPIQIQSTVKFVSSAISVTDNYRVWVEIKNEQLPNRNWLINPGMEAEIIIQ